MNERFVDSARFFQQNFLTVYAVAQLLEVPAMSRDNFRNRNEQKGRTFYPGLQGMSVMIIRSRSLCFN